MRNRQDSCARRQLVVGAILFSTSVAFSQDVTLPLAEYEALLRRTEPPDVAAPTPPAPIALETAEVELVVGRDNARSTVELTLAIYEEGWQQLALPPDGNLTLVELRGLDGRVSSSATSERVLSCRGVGRYTVRVESVIPVTTERGAARPTRSVSLTFPWAGTVTGTVASDVGTDQIELGAGGFADGTRGTGLVGFVGEPGGVFRARLYGETDTASASELPLSFEALSLATAHVSRSGIELSGFLELEILQGRMERFRVPVPREMNVLSVASVEGVELGWDLDSDGALVVRFPEPLNGTVPIRVSLARSFDAGEDLDRFEAPLLVPDSASRATVLSGLSIDDDGIPVLLTAASARRATERDLARLPDALLSRTALLFVVREPERVPAWRVEWAESDPTAVLASQVDRLVVDALVGEAGRTAYQYWAVVRSPGALSLTLKPPPGFELTAAERSGERVTAGTSPDGIVVPLAAGPEAQTVRIAGIVAVSAPPDRGTFEVPIPALSAPIARVEVRAVVPGGRRYELEAETIDTRIGDAPSRKWFAVPSSHHVVTASWSALSARPSPLLLRVRSQRDKRRWN